MDVVLLSRLQFAVATIFHFLFVPLTLGLSMLTAIFETMYVRTGDEDYKRAAKFWGKLFLINFALGIVTGITLEFQFGTNWAQYSKYMGDIFGPLLAIEATVAFFLESTFIGVWIFTWDKISKKLHAVCIWLVAIASNISALWILLANGWMQNPVGYVLRNGRAELASFLDVVTNPFGWMIFIHTIFGAYILSGFFVLGISAYHLLKKNEVNFFKKCFKVAATWTVIFALFEGVNGHFHAQHVMKVQPAKGAALEAVWETGDHVPLYLFVIPDSKNERNSVELIKIPSLTSILATHSASGVVKGLKDFPKDERPPVGITMWSFRLMAGLGVLFILLAIIAVFRKENPEDYPGFLKILLFTIPLPYIANELGWIVAEVGRQPWIVYGLMKTKDAVSHLATSQVLISLLAFIVIYSLLGAVDFYLLAKYAKKGPEPLK